MPFFRNNFKIWTRIVSNSPSPLTCRSRPPCRGHCRYHGSRPAPSWSCGAWGRGCCCPRTSPAVHGPPCSRCRLRAERTRPPRLRSECEVRLRAVRVEWSLPRCLEQAAQRKQSRWNILVFALITKSFFPKILLQAEHLALYNLERKVSKLTAQLPSVFFILL